MDQRKFHEILQRYFKGQATEKERRMVDAWYEAMGKGDPSSINHKEQVALGQRYWSVISAHIRKTRRTNKPNPLSADTRPGGVIWYSLGVAASVILVMIAYSFLRHSTSPSLKEGTTDEQQASVVWTELDNNGVAAKQLDLPDGSRVLLEPHSRLKYGPSFNKARREVFLEGEAHFEVAHNEHRPFLVHAREVTTTVLGTSFRVKAFEADKDIMVTVQTGKVKVSAGSLDKKDSRQKGDIILTPNQQIVYNVNERTMQRGIVEVPIPIPAEEKTRRTRFEEAPVAEIFRALERVYGVEILFDRNVFTSCVLTTSISDGGIYNRLDIICEAIGAGYEINEGQIVITGSGCD